MPRKKNESLHTALKGSPHMLSLPWDLWKKLVSKHSVKGEPTHAIAPMEFVPRKKNESLYTVLKGNSHMPSFPWDLFQGKKKKKD